MGDYLDLIARSYFYFSIIFSLIFRWAMKDPKEAVAFLTTCLRFNSKIQVRLKFNSLVSQHQVVEEVHGPEVMKIGPNEAEVLQDR